MKDLVVGVDGSADSLAALEWAAHVAGPSGTVRAVHAMSPTSALLVTAAQADSEELRRDLAMELDGWVAAARHRGSSIECVVVEDHPVAALLHAATQHHADAIVVGPHGRSSVLPRAIGSMTTKLIERSQVPLVVARSGASHPPLAGASIVVGVGHGEGSAAAMKWAMSFAIDHSMSLSLVHAMGHGPLFREDGLLDVLAYYIEPAKLREWAEEDLAELADDVRNATGGELSVSWVARKGSSGPQLVRAASDATLLVVGRHRDGSEHHFTVALLHHVLTHAPCPVVVVPAAEQ